MTTLGSFLLLIIPFFILIIIGLPIYASFIATCFLYILVDPGLTLQMVPPILYSGLDSFPILAIPLFIFAGDIMSKGKISERLLNFAEGIVGRLPGSTGAITVLGSMFFGMVSGSAPATTAAIGGMTVPRMMEQPDYTRGYVTSLVASAGFLGILIPPSIPFVMYGFITNTSIGDLFIAGIIPGVIMGAAYLLWNTYYAKKHKIALVKDMNNVGFLKSLYNAILAIMMPIIILGGIYSGIFTPTEAAAVAVIYSIFVSMFIYRTITLKDLFKIAGQSAYTILTFMPIFVFASVFSKIMTITNLTQAFVELMTSITTSKVILLLLVNLLFLFLGMIMDAITAILIAAPLTYPLVVGLLHLDPVHFGAMMVINLSIGMITPPLAGDLFVAMKITKAPLSEALKELWPFLIIGVAIVMLVTYVPGVSLGLLHLLGK